MGKSDSAEWEPYPYILSKILIGKIFHIFLHSGNAYSHIYHEMVNIKKEGECSNRMSALDHSCFDGGM